MPYTAPVGSYLLLAAIGVPHVAFETACKAVSCQLTHLPNNMETLSEDEDYQRFLEENPDAYAYKSKKHHYVPVFYLKGFTNPNGKFYLYDKQKDIIRESSPRSSFYEWDRNSIENNKGEKMSFIEDNFYKAVDDKCASAVSNFRDKPNTDEIYSPENIGGIDWFTLNLFIRNPKFDALFDNFLDRTKISLIDKNGNVSTDEKLTKFYNQDRQMRKVHKLTLASKAVEQLKEEKRQGKKSVKLVTFEKDVFLSCDFPIVYFFSPFSLGDIIGTEYFLPVSSKRIFYTAKNCSLEWNAQKIMLVNALLIAQAEKYICGTNRVYLEECVKYYQYLENNKLLLNAKAILWKS